MYSESATIEYTIFLATEDEFIIDFHVAPKSFVEFTIVVVIFIESFVADQRPLEITVW